jgi:hypothetical protein
MRRRGRTEQQKLRTGKTNLADAMCVCHSHQITDTDKVELEWPVHRETEQNGERRLVQANTGCDSNYDRVDIVQLALKLLHVAEVRGNVPHLPEEPLDRMARRATGAFFAAAALVVSAEESEMPAGRLASTTTFASLWRSSATHFEPALQSLERMSPVQNERFEKHKPVRPVPPTTRTLFLLIKLCRCGARN